MQDKTYDTYQHWNTEDVLKDLYQHIDNTINVNDARERFQHMIEELAKREGKLKSTVASLENTKDTLHEEISKRNEDERKVSDILDRLRDHKTEITQRIATYEHEASVIREEKEKLDNLMTRMRKTLMELKHRFHELERSRITAE